MQTFTFLLLLGICNFIFGFIWKWIAMIPAAVLAVTTKQHNLYVLRATKMFGAYLLASLTVMCTLISFGSNPGTFTILLHALIGAFVLFIVLANSQQQALATAPDWVTREIIIQEAGFHNLLVIGAVIFYVVALCIPALSNTTPVVWLFALIKWVCLLPVVDVFMALAGFLYLLYFIWIGFIAIAVMSSSAYEKMKHS